MTLFRGSQSTLLVDEVASEEALADHPDVLWYPSNDSLSEMAPNDWWVNNFGDSNWYGTVAGWDGSGGPAIVAVPEYGVNCVRWGSPYDSDHYPKQTNPVTWDSSGDKNTIMSWRKWLHHDTREAGSATGLIPEPVGTRINELYFRWMIMVESDVEDGIQDIGIKLSEFGPRADGQGLNGGGGSIWMAAPEAGSGRVRLHRYDTNASIGSEPAVAIEPACYLHFDTWHCVEQYAKNNTDVDTADAEYRIWLDDELVFERTGFKAFSTLGTVGIREISQVRAQLFHGGISFAPSQQIHFRHFGWCIANRRVGKAKLV